MGWIPRVLLIWLAVPAAVEAWFVPFLDNGPSLWSMNPWGEWIGAGGDPLSFPYGYVMWLLLKPLVMVFGLIGVSGVQAYALVLVVFDVGLLLALRALVPERDTAVLLAYWLSPIVLVATYVFGANDLVPVFFLVLTLLLLARRRPAWAGLVLAVAVSAKFSMVLAVPFFAIYFIHNRAMRSAALAFTRAFAVVAAVLFAPVILSSSAIEMIFANPEVGKIYDLRISALGVTLVYLVPLVYLLMLYGVWRVRRPNLPLVLNVLGLAFMVIVLMTPASPGWFVWLVPFLAVYQVTGDRTSRWLAAGFSLLFVLGTIVLTPFETLTPTYRATVAGIDFPIAAGGVAASLIHTLLIAAGLVLAVRVWREAITRNDYFRLSQSPFALGVAGDSGAGKDSFVTAIQGLFGAHSVVHVSGDNYHLWDRQRPMWRAMTHLNPLANDLNGFADDVVALVDGRSIQSRRYDHGTGRGGRSETMRSKDIVIASGLHALYLPVLRERFNLRVFLDMDEGLRRFLKISRDVDERGYELDDVLASMDRRSDDARRYVAPQAEHADVVYAVTPGRDDDSLVVDGAHLDLVVRSRHGFDYPQVSRVLGGVCGLHVTTAIDDGVTFPTTLRVEGSASADDVAFAVRLICPRMLEFLDPEPRWMAGTLGLMQLITIAHIDYAMTRRLIR